ncbi:MAG: HvfC/BufC family peptide modification chaperone [Sphingomonadaceae bacterium]
MPTLLEGQLRFRSILARGPDGLTPGLFTRSHERTLLGLAVHANTISHARLTALEATFPHCRAHVGEAEFNRLSRLFIETGVAGPPDRIAAGFPDWLATAHNAARSAELARFELLWLDAYHAADAGAVTLASLADVVPDALLALSIKPHPAARIFHPLAPIAVALGLDGKDFETAHALLIARPEAEVRIHALDAAAAALWDAIANTRTLGAALEKLLEHDTEADPLAVLTRLIDTGALMRVDHGGNG